MTYEQFEELLIAGEHDSLARQSVFDGSEKLENSVQLNYTMTLDDFTEVKWAWMIEAQQEV